MKKGFIMLSIGLLSFFSTLANEKIPLTIHKDFDLEPFEGVLLKHDFEVSIQYGEKQAVSITGSERFMQKIAVHVEGKKLILTMQEGQYKKLDIKVNITMPYLNYAATHKSGKIDIASFNNLDYLDLIILGSGDITSTGDITIAKQLNAQITGSGNMLLKGQTEMSEILITGSGNCKTEQLKTLETNVTLNGSGNAWVNSQKHLVAKISGSGDVYYSNSPDIKQQISGSGKVKPL